jgi:exodeoxyribonuclease V alpha subunit
MIALGKSGDWLSELTKKAFGLITPVGCSDTDRFIEMFCDHILEESGRENGLVMTDPERPGRMILFREVVEAERRIPEDLVRRLNAGPDWTPFDPGPFLRRYEAMEGKKLGGEQAEAVAMACRGGVSIMTGGPGVGKTTTLDAAIKALEAVGVSVVLMAPTGIAAKRMSQATGRDAGTLHSAIGKMEREDPEDPLIRRDCPTCLVIDETSMVNVMTLDKMLKLLPDGVSILFSGDVDQLPSIGPGQILRDLIGSEVFPVTRLNEVFRQGVDSGIVPAARAINSGEFPEETSDFRIIRISGTAAIADEVVLQCAELSRGDAFDPRVDLMILPPVKMGRRAWSP